jgi:hypothetical protein
MDEQPVQLFKETQKFSPWVYWLIYVAMLFSVIVVITSLITESIGHNPPDIYELLSLIIFGIGIPAAVAALFLLLKLETEVRSDGLCVRFFPLHIHFKKFSPEDISRVYTRKYKPLWEYGGWGIRYSIKSGKAYNTSGNEGVQLIFKSGRKLLIGSQKPQELEKAVKSIMRQ